MLIFAGKPLALVGTSYIIIAAYAVRSLPASLRAGVASLQQIDPAIEEASTSLGADAQLTFRRVTLPLIAPAFLAGLIFSFARHMTSLSAIIFLTTPKWKHPDGADPQRGGAGRPEHRHRLRHDRHRHRAGRHRALLRRSWPAPTPPKPSI